MVDLDSQINALVVSRTRRIVGDHVATIDRAQSDIMAAVVANRYDLDDEFIIRVRDQIRVIRSALAELSKGARL